MTRREPVTFVESETDFERKAFCRICEETTGRLYRLVPRFVNGLRDDKFKVCSFCGEIYPIFDIKLFTEYEPKGYVLDNPFESGTKVSVTNNKRIIKNKTTDSNETEDIPNLAGKPDNELKSILNERPGLLLNLNDDFWDD